MSRFDKSLIELIKSYAKPEYSWGISSWISMVLSFYKESFMAMSFQLYLGHLCSDLFCRKEFCLLSPASKLVDLKSRLGQFSAESIFPKQDMSYLSRVVCSDDWNLHSPAGTHDCLLFPSRCLLSLGTRFCLPSWCSWLSFASPAYGFSPGFLLSAPGPPCRAALRLTFLYPC